MMTMMTMKGKGKGKGKSMVWQPMFEKPSWGKGGWDKGWGKGKSKGKGKGKNSPFCEDMKRTGVCPRGETCQYCIAMIQRFGTNDWNDPTCWNVKMKGECTLKFCKWCPDKEDPVAGMGKAGGKGKGKSKW
eukprot:gnl/TRDRNA2_/TRDRNA2_160259_c4_seq1.p1 gnl/TRDRNA2_/TRDRNA2_160259_c4~~gnl/TRDRNA2_/TRDRNA2_160259_c4_seq1.p1  ORF type:complete len:131 (-),score=39.66 gnl/TRDRNA2_/TRDRNA2_160259_c4_seq1:72-464(-)